MAYKLPTFTREEVLEMDHKYNMHSWSAQKKLTKIIPVEKSRGHLLLGLQRQEVL